VVVALLHADDLELASILAARSSRGLHIAITLYIKTRRWIAGIIQGALELSQTAMKHSSQR